MANQEAERIKKVVYMDSNYCGCCDVSNCCGEMSAALAEIERLSAVAERAREVLANQRREFARGDFPDLDKLEDALNG